MQCPVCDGVTLIISSREGVEIDHCPQCRGVWLDRGELDKILDRSAEAAPAAPAGRSRRENDRRHEDRPPERHYDERDRRRRKRRSFLDDLFDFD